MKRIVLTTPGRFEIEEVKRPEPSAGEALVKITKVGVCGSDMHLYRTGRIGNIEITGPFVIGHECAGEVAAVGQGADPDLVSRRVAIEPAINCGRCGWCLSGNPNLCPDVLFLGLPPKQGALQEYIVHPAGLLEKIPDHLDDGGAVVLEPLAVAMQAINLVKIKPGQTVVILGTGVIGTCVLSLLSLWKPLKIVCVDPIEDRLIRAQNMGAYLTINTGQVEEVKRGVFSSLGENGADVVFECAGATESLRAMCEVAGPGAHVAVIGSNPRDNVIFSSGSARRKGLTLRFVRRSNNTLGQCIRLAREGFLSPGDLVTHTFSAPQAAQAFKLVGAYADGVLKALIDMEEWS
ncbi:MAG: alcohol dehydrogenase catalytic domain-containing protein [Deltaproteobacteria bacterium]|nr:alcohol dehydrogenase catalytic domain-containing protein [Deltaproteobacteria bacterium]